MSDDPMSASEETDDAIVGVSDSDASEKTSSSFGGGDDDDGDDDDGSVSEDFLDEPHGAPSRDHETVCEACGEGDDEPRLILCDGCDGGWHTYCLRPKLPSVPRGEWRCDACARAAAEVEAARRAERPRRTAFKRAEARMLASDDEDEDDEDDDDDDGETRGDDPARRRNTTRSRRSGLTRGAIATTSRDDSDEYRGDADDGDTDDEGDSDTAAGGGRKSSRRKKKPRGFYDLNAPSEDAARRPRRAAAARGRDFTYRFDDDDDDDELARQDVDAALCAKCKLGDDPQNFLLCDGCDAGWHTYCLRPKLPCAPRGEWLCPSCVAKHEKQHAATLESQRNLAELDLAAADVMHHKKAHLVLASRSAAAVEAGPGVADAFPFLARDPSVSGKRASPGKLRRDTCVQFLVKFEEESYRRARWVPLWAMRHREPHKLRGHWKRTGASETDPEAPLDRAAFEHVIPERVVDESDDLDAVLVKWCGLPYDECTWEPRGSFLEVSRDADRDRDGGGAESPRPAAAAARAAEDEASAREFAFGVADDACANHGVAGLLTAELRAYRARIARPPPATTPKRDFAETGVRFQDFEPLLRGGGSGSSAGENRASAAHLKAAAAAAAATGSSDPAPTSLTLHPYQREGVRWLLNKLARGQSAILGDQMGLGKTIQTAAFCDGARLLGLLSGPVLIAAPKSTVPNWSSELRTWCPTLDCVTYVGGKASREALKKVDFPFPSGPTREAHSWRRSGGGSFTDVVLTNYEVVMADASAFRTVRWGAVIVDEGHRLKNQNSALTQTLLSLRCPWRCLLTGTPLQNNLEELFALLHFLDPRRFARPDRLAAAFTARDDDDDAYLDDDDDGETRVETLSAELKNLHALLEKHMLRRLKRDVLRGLPKKRAVEVSVPLTPFQREVYADVLARNHVALNSTVNATQRTTLNNTLKELQKVCNHPFLYPAAEQDAFKAARKSGLAGKLARDATRERRVYREKVARDNETARLGAQLLPAPDVGGVGKPQHAYPDLPDAVWIDRTRVTPPMLPLEPLPATLLRTSSGKMQLLAKLLPALRARGHRVLLFCQMTRMLDIIDDWLRASGVGMERDPMDPSGMRGRRVYSRVDGATPSTTRQRVIESFNSEESVTFLMLVSTRAGGLGLNLATADTVIMYDPDFNPFVDEQAQSRAHRMGQRKEVVVYQLVTAATVEERIVELAKSKRAVERLVVKRGRDESDVPDESAKSAEIGDESRRFTKHGSVSRAAELAKVLMHGARKIVTRAAATSAEAAKSAASLEKKVNAKCEFKDSEIERLLDRENLPVEADGEDGDGYLGGVGDGRVHLENDEDEDDAVGRTTDPEEDDETRRGGDDPEDLADKQLESLLAERAARLVSAERELLGRGKRERRTVLPTNVFPRKGKKRGKDKRASSKGDRASSDTDDLFAEDPDPFVTPCFICLDVENDVAAQPAPAADRETRLSRSAALLRCESCTACAHPACAGVDEEDDATLFSSALFSPAPLASSPPAWHCGSGGLSCAHRGKKIDGGRAAAVAAVALKGKRSKGKRSKSALVRNGSSGDSDSDSMGGENRSNADDSDDGYDPNERSDSESESEFREGKNFHGRKKRRLSGERARNARDTRSTRLAKMHAALANQLDWLRRRTANGDNGDPVSRCVAASAEYETLSSLAAALEPSEVLRNARGGFPIDLLLVLRAACRLDRACAFAADAVWTARLSRQADSLRKTMPETSARVAKCEEAFRATLDPARFQKIAAQNGWSEQDARAAAANVASLRRAAIEKERETRERHECVMRNRAAVARWAGDAPSRAKATLERRFQATLKNEAGPFGGKNRTVGGAALKRAVASCALIGELDDVSSVRFRAFFEDSLAAFAEYFAKVAGDADSANDLRGAAAFLWSQGEDGPEKAKETRDPAGGERRTVEESSEEETRNTRSGPEDADRDKKSDCSARATEGVQTEDAPAPWRFLRDSSWHPYLFLHDEVASTRDPPNPRSGTGQERVFEETRKSAPPDLEGGSASGHTATHAPSVSQVGPASFQTRQALPSASHSSAPAITWRGPVTFGGNGGAPAMTFHGPVTFTGGAGPAAAPPHVPFRHLHAPPPGMGMPPAGMGMPPALMHPPGMFERMELHHPFAPGMGSGMMMRPFPGANAHPQPVPVLQAAPPAAPAPTPAPVHNSRDARTPCRELIDAYIPPDSLRRDVCESRARVISRALLDRARTSPGVDVIGECFNGCVALATEVLAAAYRPNTGSDAMAAAREYNRFEVARVVADLTAEADPRAADAERVKTRGHEEWDGGAMGGETGSLGRTYNRWSVGGPSVDRRLVNRWSTAEEEYFLTLCEKHGAGKWTQILAEGQQAGKLRADLTPVNLKDKFRNLTRRPGVGPTVGDPSQKTEAEPPNAAETANVEQPPAPEREPPSSPPSVVAAIDLTADDDDDDETLGDIAFHIEQRRLAALAKRRSASAAAEAEKRESAMDPDPSARVVSISPSKSPVSPALERQVMAFFKRRSDEIEAAKTTSTRSAETEPSAPTAISTRTKETPLAYDETPPDEAPAPASVDAKVQTKPPFFERTGVASEDGSREEYHRAPPGYFESTGSRRLVLATSLRGDGGDDDDFEPSLLRAMPGEWAFAAIGPAEALAEACESFPRGRPVKFVKKMRNAHGRWGVALETRAGCVRLCTHDPARPGKPTKLWFPLEALRALKAASKPNSRRDPESSARYENGNGNGKPPVVAHVARLLSDVSLVKRLCDTLPTASPVRFVRAIGYRCGSTGALVESRGEIIKVRFEARFFFSEDEKEALSEEAVATLRKPFTTWLPVECVAIVTPWE